MSAYMAMTGLWENKGFRVLLGFGVIFGALVIFSWVTGNDSGAGHEAQSKEVKVPGNFIEHTEVSEGSFGVKPASDARDRKPEPAPPAEAIRVVRGEGTGPAMRPAPAKPQPRLPAGPLRIYYGKKPTRQTILDYEPSEESAPFGRLLKCELVITIDSNSVDAPIIGLVVDDLYWGGELIVPANSEIHGKARSASTRDRIGADGDWVIVLYERDEESRREMIIQGTVLDREEAPDGLRFALTDGSPGLRGEVIQTLDNKEIKLFASSFLSGFSRTFQTRNSTAFGEQVQATVGNAALEGTSEVLDEYADQIRRAIEREGQYVRVPAGKQFYVYVRQTVDLRAARAGATSIFRAGASRNELNGIQSNKK